MNNEAEAADLILRITLNGTAYFFKLAATLSKPIIDKVAQAIHEALYSHGIGTTDPVMAELIKRGEGLSVFQIPETELGIFQEIMKPTGIKYATVLSKEETAEDRTTLIICSSGEAEVINRILVQNRLHGRSVADATQEKQEPVEKPEAPVEAVTPEQDSEEAKKRNAEFVKYYIKREGSSEENPTQATERKNESPSVTGSTTTGRGLSSELDIETLPSEIEYEKAKKEIRFSVRDRLDEIKDDMKKNAQAPAAEAPAKSSVLESVEQQLKSQAGKDPQIGE